MRNYLIDESAAKRLARPFEQLVVRLLESQYAHTPFTCVTVASHDGGFDGILKLGVLASQGVDHLSLVEAKLRSSRELELSAIGKSIVVAFNASANALFLATNRAFAPQALKQLALFQWKTNLRIVLLDGGVLSAWVRKARPQLTEFDAELLDFVSDPEPRTKPVLDHIDPEDETPIQSYVSTVAKLPRYELMAGWDGDVLAPNELRPTNDVREETRLLPMFGRSRGDALTRLAGLLERERGIALVSGAAGEGKSFFVRHLRRELASRGMASTLVSMTAVTTRRMYLLRLLAAVTGANVEAIASEKGPEGLEIFLATFSAEGHPSERQSVAAVLASSAHDPFREQGDLRTEVIMRYIQKLARRTVRPQALFYDNLEHSTREVLELMRLTSRELVDAGVSTVFEARRFGEAGTVADTSDVDEQRLSPEEWGVVRGTLESSATLDLVELEGLTNDEALSFIESQWPGFGPERAQVVIRAVGSRPLFIETALNWLQATRAVVGDNSAIVVRDLETFFDRISPSRISLLFEQHLNLWRRKFEAVFAAASLLDGRIPLAALPIIAPDESVAASTRTLLKTRLFELDPSTDALRVTHPKVTTTLQRLFGAGTLLGRSESAGLDTALALRSAARTLLPHLQQILEPDQARFKEPFLLGAAAQWPGALQAAQQLIEAERTRGEWANVSSLATLALVATQHSGLPERERNDAQLATLITLTEAEERRGRVALDVNTPHVAEMELRVRTTPFMLDAAQWPRLRIQALLLAANHHYAREEFEAALQAASEAEQHALGSLREVGNELCARAFHFHGLALKGLDRRDESFRVYREAVALLPDVQFLRNEELSNLAAFNLLSRPSAALKYYRSILAARKNEPDQGKLHVLVDVAMAEFLRKRYAAARTAAQHARHVADAVNHLLEGARACNILGCCTWVAGDVAEADLLFDSACFSAERTLTKRYLWRLRVNRSGTALELGRSAYAVTLARVAEEMITVPRSTVIRNFQRVPDLLHSRWYAALVALGAIYLRADRREYDQFLERVPIRFLAIDSEKAVTRRYRRDVFGGTTTIHADRIMITG